MLRVHSFYLNSMQQLPGKASLLLLSHMQKESACCNELLSYKRTYLPTSDQKKENPHFFVVFKGNLFYRKSLEHSSICKENKQLYIFSETHPDL